MPKKIEHTLMREAAKKGFTGERRDRYVYGTLANIEKRRAKMVKQHKKAM